MGEEKDKTTFETPSTPPPRPKGRWLKCPKCGYQWWCKSDKRYVSCPSCLRKSKVPQ